MVFFAPGRMWSTTSFTSLPCLSPWPAILRLCSKGMTRRCKNNKMFVILFALSAIWLILILNYIGLRFGKWVENIADFRSGSPVRC